MNIIKKLIVPVSVILGVACSSDGLDNSNFDSMFPPITVPEGDGGGETVPAPDSKSIRIVTYNIKHCAGSDGIIDYARVAGVLQEFDADVICLQEVDNKTQRSSYVDQLAKLNEWLGMNTYYGKAFDYDGGEFGNGVLMKKKPISEKTIIIPGAEGRARSVAFVELENYVVASAHLDLELEKRLASIDAINEQAKSYGKPVFLAGDFNEPELDGEFFTAFKKDWTIGSRLKNSFPAKAPTRVIDFVVSLNGFGDKVSATDVIHSLKGHNIGLASDHCPVYCDFVEPGAVEVPDEYPKKEGALRIASYCVDKCRGVDGEINYDRIAAVIQGSKADIVCMQGVLRNAEESGNLDQMQELASRTGMTAYFSPAAEYQGGHSGNGILTLQAPVNTYEFNYPGAEENRSAMMAEFDDFAVISAAFDTDIGKRIEMIDGLTSEAEKLGKAVYLAGYFNDSDLSSAFMERVREKWTIISSDDKTQHVTDQRVDFILSLNTFIPTVDHAGTVTVLNGTDVETASEHYLIYSDIMGSRPAEEASSEARIVSYYANYCCGTDKKIDYDRIANVIKELDADVFCLQGMDQGMKRSEYVDQTAKLAELTGMIPFFAPGKPQDPGFYGNGILTKTQPISTDAFTMGDEANIRSVMCVEYPKFVVMSTFFATNIESRISALNEITEKAKSYGKAVLLVGYFNDTTFDLPVEEQSDFVVQLNATWDLVSPMEITEHTKGRKLDFIYQLKGTTLDIKESRIVTSLTTADLKVAAAHYPMVCDLQNLKD